MEPRFILKTQAAVEGGFQIWALASPAVREKIEKEAIFALVALVWRLCTTKKWIRLRTHYGKKCKKT